MWFYSLSVAYDILLRVYGLMGLVLRNAYKIEHCALSNIKSKKDQRVYPHKVFAGDAWTYIGRLTFPKHKIAR